VSTVSQNTYSALVGEFVNDAKRLVEDAWDWSALRTTLTVSTTPDIFNYSLTGSGNRIELLDVINDTSNFFMKYRVLQSCLMLLTKYSVTLLHWMQENTLKKQSTERYNLCHNNYRILV
jgi:hypothetical protein